MSQLNWKYILDHCNKIPYKYRSILTFHYFKVWFVVYTWESSTSWTLQVVLATKTTGKGQTMSCTDSLYTWDAVLGTSLKTVVALTAWRCHTHSSHSRWCAYSDSINQGPATFLVIARDFRFALLPLCLRKTLVVCLCKGSFILSSQWHVRDTTWSSRDKFQISFLSSKSVLSFSRITRDCSRP